MTALSKSCYYHTREVCCIHSYLDFKIASTIATSNVHSKIDYCNFLYHNFLYHNLPNYQLNRLQQIQNSLALLLMMLLRLLNPHISLPFSNLHWLKVNERIEYKLLSLTYKVLTTSQTSYLNNLIIIIIISLLKTHVRRTCLHSKNITMKHTRVK